MFFGVLVFYMILGYLGWFLQFFDTKLGNHGHLVVGILELAEL